VAGYHEDPEVIQLHRVIGGYITIFSQLISGMRQSMYRFLGEPDAATYPRNRLIGVLFNNMTARPITDSFFAMCLEIAEFNQQDLAIKRTLQSWTQRHISVRNDISHADWEIGWVFHETDEPVPPSATKTRMSGGRLVNEHLRLGAKDIVNHISDLEHLRIYVAEFGRACESIPTDMPYHPSDILEVYDVPEISAKRVRARRMGEVGEPDPG